jgi:hypothetical protein
MHTNATGTLPLDFKPSKKSFFMAFKRVLRTTTLFDFSLRAATYESNDEFFHA